MTSAATGRGVVELVAAVRTSIEWDRLRTTITTEAFKRIKAKVLEAKAASANMDVLVSLPRLRRADRRRRRGDRELLDAVHNLSRHGFVHHLLTPEGGPGADAARAAQQRGVVDRPGGAVERNGLGVVDEGALVRGEVGF